MTNRRRAPRVLLPIVILAATVAGFVMVGRGIGGQVVDAAASPHWGFLAAAFGAWALIQPLRAVLWRVTLGEPIEFRAVYAASAVGSFLDTVAPARAGEVSKVGILRVTSGEHWPGLAGAGGSLLAKHMLDGIGFAVVGAAAALFLPIPGWAQLALLSGAALAAGAMAAAGSVHRRLGRLLPAGLDTFLVKAACPRDVLVKGTAIAVATWLVKWAAVFFLLHAVGVTASLGAAMLYLLMTALAGIAPLLPGNVGVYQGAAVGALAMAGEAGANAVAASLLAPAVGSIAAGAAALVALLFYGGRALELARGAVARA